MWTLDNNRHSIEDQQCTYHFGFVGGRKWDYQAVLSIFFPAEI